MRLRHIGISLAVMSFAAWAPIVSAQESREDKFRAWDSNHDGLLSMGEMQQNQANFRAMVTDPEYVWPHCIANGMSTFVTQASSPWPWQATVTSPPRTGPNHVDPCLICQREG